ncbi:response regulator transcription factor [Candidatus Galacturonibacter soehngenii]|uniref:Stage 0 sporulation protein A homolog n=1 Tax=Candidatus Galacturonatibacter soehngenii TaxID=2307010 RepID=A0A7V7QIA5_9FIRM|nr:response regulator transcription factor [Candidatus Galacturonibacter soehngenii]KAB1435917.1 response regulator transcription factor [Candidatus Galacturonibacter soehngenii]
MYQILIVEDDKIIESALIESLTRWGFSAVGVKDLSNVMKQFHQVKPQIVLMDISLPFYNGYYWCSEIRKISKIPIIFLSSHSENMDIVMAINMGGDDYITKPFPMEVLVAKVQALLRRTYDYRPQTNQLEHKGAVLDLNDASLYYQDEKIELTKNEFRILEILMKNKNEVVSRERIMKKLWDNDSFIDDNTLTVNMNRLRRKLEGKGLNGFIETKKGLGYIVHN